MKGIELVVLDMAGTTVADKGNVADAFLSAFAESGHPINATAAQKVMGFRKSDAIRMLLAELYPLQARNQHLIGIIHQAFTGRMLEYYQSSADLKPLPHAEEIFEILAGMGIRRALNTGFTSQITRTILDRLGWEEGTTIDCVISSDEVAQGRPEPDMIRAIMKDQGISDPRKVLKIGDTGVDIEEGRKAGCGAVIAVTTGAYSRESLETFRPDRIINSLAELPQIIESLS